MMIPPTLGNAVQIHLGRDDVQFGRDETYESLAATWRDPEPIPDRETIEQIHRELMRDYFAALARYEQEENERRGDLEQIAPDIIQQAIAQIGKHIQDSTADAEAALSATQLAQFRSIMVRMLEREKAAYNREQKMMKAIRHLLKNL